MAMFRKIKTTMKKIILFSIASFIAATAFTQNIGIGTTNPINKLEVTGAVESSLLATVYANNTGTAGSGLQGISDSLGTTGVQGTSNNGIGVYGFSNSNIAIAANAAQGTALYASSITGLALSTSGKLQFSGLNTNPSSGAVLTSDASGNAVWKPKKIGFVSCRAVNTAVPLSTFRKVEFTNEEVDHQNNFTPYAGILSAATSVFTAPVAGYYHFSTGVMFENNIAFSSGQIRLVKNNSSTVIANSEAPCKFINPILNYYYASLYIQGDYYLNANDKVWVEVAQRNNGGDAIGLNSAPAYGRFSGFLRFAN